MFCYNGFRGTINKVLRNVMDLGIIKETARKRYKVQRSAMIAPKARKIRKRCAFFFIDFLLLHYYIIKM